MKTVTSELRQAFSLIEMMVVLGVVGLLLAFAAPNLFSLITANTLSGEGNLLRNQLTLAQQNAVSKSSDVEVRFFKFKDESAADTEEAFQGYQLYEYNLDGEMVPSSAFFRIRSPVAVHVELSTLLDTRAQKSNLDEQFGFTSPTPGTADAPVGLGGQNIETEFISFRFRPDGSTDLPFRSENEDTWYLTLVQGEGAVNNMNPDNYFCLQVNPYNGKVSEFRP